ncbi:hypothetical protein X797_010244 [Metarhizium robertsii]|uniref:Uncharacterized protein n=1 Tax=Metarhizium robertsii TaxID=568076 RepID=A0A014QUD8_9HYPO|nr:hypothetical protein X797_010244 [Metarhizium robertsii]
MAALDPPRWTSRSKELTSVEGLESGVKLLRCLLREPTQALAPPESAATFNESTQGSRWHVGEARNYPIARRSTYAILDPGEKKKENNLLLLLLLFLQTHVQQKQSEVEMTSAGPVSPDWIWTLSAFWRSGGVQVAAEPKKVNSIDGARRKKKHVNWC